jgi:hypothetical protein
VVSTVIAVLVLSVGVLCLISCLEHIANPAQLRSELLAHGVLPTRLVPLVPGGLAVAELGLAAAASAVVLGGQDLVGATGRGVLVLGAGLFLVFAWYTSVRLASGSSGSCACSMYLPADALGVVSVRALCVAAVLVVGAVVDPPALASGELAATVAMSTTLALLLWTLPAAMSSGRPVGSDVAQVSA